MSQARTWASPTPESEQDKLAGFSLLTKVVRQNMDWSFVEKGWWAALAPEGHALQFPTGQPLYVIRSYKRAALVWPGKLQTSPAGDIVSLELEDPRVGWVHLFDEAVDVLDLAATSPQRGLAHESLVFSTDSAVSIDFGHSFLNPKPQNQRGNPLESFRCVSGFSRCVSAFS